MQKKLATGIALAFVCLPAMAESDIGFYSGVGASHATLKDSISGVGIKATGTGYTIFGGYRFNEYGSLEIGYAAGEADDTISGATVELDASAIQGSALLHIPISARFEGFARVGFLAWDTENSIRAGQLGTTWENDGTDWILGLGAAFHITPSFGLRAEYEGAELDGTDLRSICVSALINF